MLSKEYFNFNGKTPTVRMCSINFEFITFANKIILAI